MQRFFVSVTADGFFKRNNARNFNWLIYFLLVFLMNHKWAPTLRYPVQKENTDRKNE
jgi:hypothetical protein